MCYWKSALPRLVTTCWRGWEWFSEGSWITEILFIYSESPFFANSSQLAVAAFHDFVSDWMNCVNEVWLKEGTAEGANVGRKSEEDGKNAWDIRLRVVVILVKAAESAKCWFLLALWEEKTGQNKVRDRDIANMDVSFVMRQIFFLNGYFTQLLSLQTLNVPRLVNTGSHSCEKNNSLLRLLNVLRRCYVCVGRYGGIITQERSRVKH